MNPESALSVDGLHVPRISPKLHKKSASQEQEKDVRGRVDSRHLKVISLFTNTSSHLPSPSQQVITDQLSSVGQHIASRKA